MKNVNHHIKKGISLAETLLVLCITGSLATFTIPALIENVQNAVFKITWKEAFSELSQVTNRIKLDNGGTLAGAFSSETDMENKYSNYMINSKICQGDYSCWHAANTWYWMNSAPVIWESDYAWLLNNGIVVELSFAQSDCGNTTYSVGIPVCGWAYIDVNGQKGPNTLGRDIFSAWITKNSLLPDGTIGDGDTNSCNTSDTGLGCGAVYLRQ